MIANIKADVITGNVAKTSCTAFAFGLFSANAHGTRAEWSGGEPPFYDREINESQIP